LNRIARNGATDDLYGAAVQALCNIVKDQKNIFLKHEHTHIHTKFLFKGMPETMEQ